MKKIPTMNVWTSGIVNVPLSPKLKDSRYTLFEIDTKNVNTVHKVLEIYDSYLGSVYVHETLNGFHFYNLTPIDKKLYGEIIRQIKPINPECPLTTLRLLPNKWENEARYWNKGALNGYDVKLANFRNWLENDKSHMIALNYQVVRYPFEECPLCDKEIASKYVIWNNRRKIFICSVHNVQTIGRLRKRKKSCYSERSYSYVE